MTALMVAAPIFAMVIRRIRQLQPGCSIEVLIPDFKGSEMALKIVMDAQPEILNHNVETVPRLFKKSTTARQIRMGIGYPAQCQENGSYGTNKIQGLCLVSAKPLTKLKKPCVI